MALGQVALAFVLLKLLDLAICQSHGLGVRKLKTTTHYEEKKQQCPRTEARSGIVNLGDLASF